MANPVLKWAGGKSSIIDKIGTKLDKIPQKNSTFFDVFAGGLSVTIKFHKRFGSVVINDTNKELINTYNVIKKEPQKLIEMLRTHEANHSHDYYYFIRDQDKKKENKEDDLIDKAARMIYLNKTCYNGLYRVNSKGHFNVPIGRQNKIKLFDKDNIYELSSILKNIDIRNQDFSVTIKDCKPGDIVYIDPPYDKINKNSFVEYNTKRFDEFDQERLKKEIDELTKKGVFVIASNSLTEFTANLYKDYIDDESIILVRRSISSSNSSRGKIEEILIDNFKMVNKNANYS